MINKQSSKLFLGMLAMLVGLTGCLPGKTKVVDSSSRKKEVEGLQPEIKELKIETKPATYLIVGFAGLTDPGTHPADWSGKIQKMIVDKPATSTNKSTTYTLLIKRSSEDMTIEKHANEADQQILNYLLDQGIEDFNNVKLILVAESYGGLVAAQLALKNNLSGMGISIAGLITVRTSWEGVNLVHAIPTLAPLAQQLKQMLPDMANMIDSYNKCQKALETLNPNGPFITELKNNGLSTLKFPILALAGKDIQPTFPYAGLQGLPLLAIMFPQLQPAIQQILPLLDPYKSGNDGLVLTSSAITVNSIKGTKFESYVLSGFPHFGNTTNHTVALGHVKNFVDKIVK